MCDCCGDGFIRFSEWYYTAGVGRWRAMWCGSCGDELGRETVGGLHASLITV